MKRIIKPQTVMLDMGTKARFITVLLFLTAIMVCLFFIFDRPITWQYQEADNVPGYSEGDQLFAVIKGWQFESITQQPNYFAGLVGVLILNSIGFAYSISAWEKSRQPKEGILQTHEHIRSKMLEDRVNAKR